MRLVRSALILVTMLLLTGACAQQEADDSSAPAAEETEHAADHGAASEDGVAIGVALAQLRAHQAVAAELFAAGDAEAALEHASEPVEEVLASLGGDLDAATADAVTASAQTLREAIIEGAAAEDVDAAQADAAAEADAALESAAGEESGTAAFKGSVVARLVATAAHEYEEAVGDGSIDHVDEYQDGYGFLQEAHRIYDEIRGDVESASAEEAEEIEEGFATLDAAFPGIEPPSAVADVEELEAAASLIGHELEETVGALPVEESDPAAVAAEINELLDEIEAAYEAGDAEVAAELAAEAYLENYEVIEAEVIEYAPEVNAELEPLLGAELRAEMKAGAPVEQVLSMIDRARELLAQALAAVEESHS